MTYVVTETCIKCKYTDCVDVCPVDCFREGPNMLVIDPGECIDCTLCVAECPVGASRALRPGSGRVVRPGWATRPNGRLAPSGGSAKIEGKEASPC